MPGTPTSKHGIARLAGGDSLQTIDTTVNTALDTIDALMATADKGTLASRPVSTAGAPGKVGRLYYAIDFGLVFFDHGTGWAPVGVPIGGLMEYAGVGDPCDELLLADGREIAASDYPGFNAIVGNRYGTGSPGTIRLPDLRGRTTVAPDDMGTGRGDAARLTANDTLGAAGGAEKQTLSEAETPWKTTASEAGGYGLGQTIQFTDRVAVTRESSGAHNNMPPFTVVNKLIRVR